MIWHGATSSSSWLQNASKPSAMAAAVFMCTCPNYKFTAPLRHTERSWPFESLNPIRNTAVSLFRSNNYSSLLSLLFPQDTSVIWGAGTLYGNTFPMAFVNNIWFDVNKCAAMLWNQWPFHIWIFMDGGTENLVKSHSLQYTWVLPAITIISRQGGVIFFKSSGI